VGPWPGMRVRVATGQSSIIGTVVRASADQLVVNPSAGGPEQTLRRGDWESLAVSRGTYNHVRAGALVGMLFGSVVGGLVASGAADPNDPYAGVRVLSGAMLGALAGILIGAPLGAGMRTEVWSEVPQQ